MEKYIIKYDDYSSIPLASYSCFGKFMQITLAETLINYCTCWVEFQYKNRQQVDSKDDRSSTCTANLLEAWQLLESLTFPLDRKSWSDELKKRIENLQSAILPSKEVPDHLREDKYLKGKRKPVKKFLKLKKII